MKKSKGITLIALVITVIILLILAGVSIAMLTGNNGILNKATTAKEQTKQVQAKEKIQLEVLGSIGNDGKVDLETLKTNIIEHIPEATISGDTFPLTVTVDGQTFIINENGNVEEKSVEPINVEDIASNEEIFKKVAGGKVLNYGTDSEIEWKIFYADNSGIFLITSDYVPVSKLASQKESLGFTDDGHYNIMWTNSSDFKVTQIDDAIASKFMLNEKSSFTTPSNENYKMTACLLDTASWETFRDTRWANENSVIGGATLEMYIASWNKKYPENKLYKNTNSTGYYVGASENPTSYVVNMSSTPGYQDELYYPHREGWNSSYGYWLASPSAINNYNGMLVFYDGSVCENIYNNNSLRSTSASSSKV